MIIGITGPAGAGKDTLADLLIERFGKHVLSKRSFAEPLKKMLRDGLGITDAQLHGDKKEVVDQRYGCSARYMMQSLGTEWGRYHIHPDIWVIAMADMLDGKTLRHVVIPDVRFENEASFVRQRGVLIHIEDRGGLLVKHPSEAGVDNVHGDITVYNSGSIEDLKNAVQKLHFKI